MSMISTGGSRTALTCGSGRLRIGTRCRGFLLGGAAPPSPAAVGGSGCALGVEDSYWGEPHRLHLRQRAAQELSDAMEALRNEASRIQALLLQAQSDLSSTRSSLQTAQRDNDRLNSRVDEKDRQLDARDADLNKVNA